MPEKYVPHEQEGQIIIRIVTGYDQFGKPLTETRPAEPGEIQKLQENKTHFEIVMKPEDHEDIDKIV